MRLAEQHLRLGEDVAGRGGGHEQRRRRCLQRRLLENEAQRHQLEVQLASGLEDMARQHLFIGAAGALPGSGWRLDAEHRPRRRQDNAAHDALGPTDALGDCRFFHFLFFLNFHPTALCATAQSRSNATYTMPA